MNLAIPKNKYRHSSENYAFLRAEGLKYIEKLTSQLWTDYNIHDPGITILEALCLSITDLAYRTSFDIRDILAKADTDYTTSQPPIFTARDILTTVPWTLTDWRKLLVDIEGVQNAWLFVSPDQEVDFYANCNKEKLEYFLPDRKIEAEKLLNKEAPLDLWLKDKSNFEKNEIFIPFPLDYLDSGQNGITRYVDLEVKLPGWLYIQTHLAAFVSFANLNQITSITLINASFDNNLNIWRADVKLFYTYQDKKQEKSSTILLKGVEVNSVANLDAQQALIAALTNINPNNPFRNYQQHLLLRLSYITEHKVNIHGLTDILLEFEQDEKFGNLNSPLIEYELLIPDEKGQLKSTETEVLFVSWQEIYENIKDYRNFIISNKILFVNIVDEFFDSVNKTWTTTLSLEYEGQGTLPDIILPNVEFRNIESPAVADIVKSNLFQLTESSVLGIFHGKLKRLLSIVDTVEYRFHENRSLCEDLRKIESISVNEIGICAEIELKVDADIEKVQAEIFYQVEQYMSPPITFNSLQELVDKKVPTEEIFNGPALEHGFILSEEIEQSGLSDYSCIYASDLINIIMDIEGVLAVKEFSMTKYNQQGEPVFPSQKWTIKLDYRHKAKLSINKSELLFIKDALPYKLRNEREANTLKELKRLRVINDRSKLVGTQLDFYIPEGSPLPLKSYTTLRYHFPETYGVRPAGLSGEVNSDRMAKAKQLKAYLAFMDQLLANYLSQLSELNSLLSVEEDIVQTYFTQFLSSEQLGEDLYIDKLVLEDVGPDFKSNSLQRLVESEATFLDRRNRFLDHLLGRFAENFNDYALLMNDALGKKAPKELIKDKISFLKLYPILSRERGNGFNYKDEDQLWDTDNVPGLQKRVSRLLGMDNFERHDLHCPTLRDYFQVIEKLDNTFSFVLERFGVLYLNSVSNYPSEQEAFLDCERTISLSQKSSQYLISEEGGQFKFEIADHIVRKPDGRIESKEVLAVSGLFDTEEEAKSNAKQLKKILADEFEAAPAIQITEKTPGAYFIEIVQYNGLVASSVSTLTSYEEALTLSQELENLMVNITNYDTVEVGDQFVFQIGKITRDAEGSIADKKVIVQSINYNSNENAVSAANHLQKLLSGSGCTDEGFHIIEHLLLRPKSVNDALFSVCLNDDCKFCGEEDPYSFRVTVLLPYWMNRFQDPFLRPRKYVDQLLRQEAPAHVFLKICWIGNEQMRQFETRFKRWLEENAKVCPDPDLLTTRLNDLIATLEHLQNVYSTGVLHDCDDSETNNTIILNRSFLGETQVEEEEE